MHEEEDGIDPNWFGAPEDQPFRKSDVVAKDTTCPTPVVESSTAKTPPAPVPQPEPVAAVSDEQMAWRLENGGAASYVKSARLTQALARSATSMSCINTSQACPKNAMSTIRCSECYWSKS